MCGREGGRGGGGRGRKEERREREEGSEKDAYVSVDKHPTSKLPFYCLVIVNAVMVSNCHMCKKKDFHSSKDTIHFPTRFMPMISPYIELDMIYQNY